MRILYITTGIATSDGWGQYSRTLISRMRDRGNVVYTVTPVGPNAHTSENSSILKGPLRFLANPLLSFSTARRVSRVIAAFRPDIVHILAEPYGTMVPFLQVPSGTKIFMTVHGTYSFIPNILRPGLRRWFSKYLTKATYERLDQVISVSEYTKKYLLAEYSRFFHFELPDSKVKVITNGIALPAGRGEGVNSKKGWNRVLFVGAVKRRKGLLELLEALRVYDERYQTKIVLDVVGSLLDTEYVSLVRGKIEAYSLTQQVNFHGILSDADRDVLYAAADCFALISLPGTHFEGFGLVYLEANAWGLPTIGSRNSGAADAILEGKTGYLVDPFDPRGIAEAIHKILADKALRPEDCRQWAMQHTIEDATEGVSLLYTRVLTHSQ